MSNENGFILALAFKVKKSTSPKFRRWMKKHFGDLDKTGCFEADMLSVLDTKSSPDFNTGIYLHSLKGGKRGWKRYQRQFRPKLKEEFMAKWGEAIENGDLSLIQTAAPLI